MKIKVISDTHGFHGHIPTEPCDMIIHAGDATNYRDTSHNRGELIEFISWYKNYPAKYKIYVPGNHDMFIYNVRKEAGWLFHEAGIDLMIHEELHVEGIKIFGSPRTPVFGQWGFMYAKHKGDRIWSDIPDDTDILVTHGPPWGIMDATLSMKGDVQHIGCKNLLQKSLEVSPKFHIFGHNHDQQGMFLAAGYDTTFINAAAVNLRVKKVVCEGFNIGI